MIIKRITTISWLPFNSPETQPMYQKLDQWVRNINGNHFGFDGIQITENAQYTEYPTELFMNGILIMIQICVCNHLLEKYL